MKKKLVVATNNAHKLEEISAILGDEMKLLSLKDINCHADIPETSNTLEGNARQKAMYIYENYGMDCFADDTGLEVDALNGAPGVFSARYAGEGHDSEANMQKLLKELEDRVITEACTSPFLGDNFAFYNPFEKILLTFHYQTDGCTELCISVFLTF